MNKTLIAIVGIIIVGAVIFYAFKTPKETVAPVVSPSPSVSVEVTATTTGPQTVTVIYSNTGFSPKEVTVNVGDTVKFINDSTASMWVGADEHPTHKLYDGTDLKTHCAEGYEPKAFDQCMRGVEYSYTFTKAGTWKYHNHSKSADVGTVIVK
jgi:plastocyanin